MHHQLNIQLTSDHLQNGVVWEGWGTSLAWFAVALGGQRHVREAISTLLFSQNPAEGLGMNIVRYNIGGACQAQAAEYRTGAAVPCFKQPDGSYNWSVDDNQVAMLQSAAQHGVDTFEAFVNSPPWFWTKSGSSRGHKMPLADNLQRQHVEAFAQFCGDVVEHFADVHNIQFSSLSPFNEPCSPAWCLKAGNKQEGCYFSRSRMFQVLHALAQQPALRNHQVQLVAFEQFCLRDTLSDLNHLNSDFWNIIQRINLHTYTSKHFLPSIVRPYLIWQDNIFWRHRVRRLAHKKQKKIWISEFGSGRGAFTIAKQVVRDLVQLRPTAWVYWQAVEAPGSNWGLLEAPLETGAVTAAATSAAADDAGTASSGQLEQEVPVQITLHPNYFVLHFIMQCIPKGSTVYRVKQLGKCGLLVQCSAQHWVLLFLNTSRSRQKQLSLDAAALAQLALRVTSTGRASSVPVTPTDSSWRDSSQPSSSNAQAEVSVRLLDIGSLQPTMWKPGLVISSKESVSHAGVMNAAWPMMITVPEQNLCRVDLIC